MSLEQVREIGRRCRIEARDQGFAIRRRPDADRSEFNAVVASIVNGSGDHFVALPQPDGRRGYDGVFILPLD